MGVGKQANDKALARRVLREAKKHVAGAGTKPMKIVSLKSRPAGKGKRKKQTAKKLKSANLKMSGTPK